MSNQKSLTGTEGFDKNPQNINRKGRPRKSFSTINEAMKKDGIEPLTKSQLIEAYSLVFNSTQEDLKKLRKDKDTPYAMRIIIDQLNKTSTKIKALNDYRDYMFGRAAHTVGIEAKQVIEVQYRNVSKQFDDEGKPLKDKKE
ncbi:MAG: hypothetical protein ACUZ8H_01490 [Candidatus Anammoxibacter sp.]